MTDTLCRNSSDEMKTLILMFMVLCLVSCDFNLSWETPEVTVLDSDLDLDLDLDPDSDSDLDPGCTLPPDMCAMSEEEFDEAFNAMSEAEQIELVENQVEHESRSGFVAVPRP